MIRRLRESSEGYVLITALIAMGVLAILAATVLSLATAALRESAQAVRTEQALYMANAGLEDALARVRSGQGVRVGEAWSGAVSLQPGLEGSYAVAIEPDADRAYVRVRSTGTVEGASKSLTARLRLPVPTPVIYRQALLGTESVTLENNSLVCGTVVSAGEINLNKVNLNKLEDTCGELSGSVAFISAVEVVGKENQIEEKQICSPKQYGEGFACAKKPEIEPMPSVDLDRLKAQATHWYVQDPGEGCDSAPEGAACGSIGQFRMDRLPSPSLAYVEGGLDLPNGETARIPGGVTVIFADSIDLGNGARLLCQGAAPCQAAVYAAGDVTLQNVSELHAALHTLGTFTALQNSSVFGSVLASLAIIENNAVIKPPPYDPAAIPPGLILPDGSYSGSGGHGSPGEAGPEGFESWSQ